jgi:hypothetical protein
MSHGSGEVAVILAITLALLIGVLPGVWIGACGYERDRGHPWLAAVVAVVAIAGVSLYTFGGGADELFTRIVILPLTIIIAIASSAVLIGMPMYAGYVVSYRVARSISKKGKGSDPII